MQDMPPTATITSTVPTWTLGDRLRKARELAGISSNDMAVQFSRSRAAISGWENDHHRPTLLCLRQWAEITGVSLAWLRGESEQATTSSPWTPDRTTALATIVIGQPFTRRRGDRPMRAAKVANLLRNVAEVQSRESAA